MKVKIEVELSPEEARSFLGLPDLSSVHQAFVDQARGKIEDAASLVDIAPLVKTWTGLGGMAQDVVGSFLSAAMNTKPTRSGSGSGGDSPEAGADKPGKS